MSIPLFGSIDKTFVLCADVLVKCVGHKMIQDSHFFRNNRTNESLYLFDGKLWYFTEQGLTWNLQQSNKKIAKSILAAFKNALTSIRRTNELKQAQVPFQSLIQKIESTQTLMTELEQYKSMLSVQHMLFQGRQFKIYGNYYTPLFLVNDIVCGLLGMRDITNNQFFRDNCNNIKYVTTLEFPGCPPDVQDRYKSNKPTHIYFFTEKGLYKCLMRSNKPIADQFQDEICELLTNIRCGYIQLVQTASVSINQSLEQSVASIQELVQLHSDTTAKLNKQSDLLDKCRKQIDLYEIKTKDGRSYRGQTGNFNSRIKQHRRNSCSPSIRDAYKNNLIESEQVIRSVEVFNNEDIKYYESNFIQEVDPDTRLNINIPQPDMCKVIVDQPIEAAVIVSQQLEAISEIVSVQEANQNTPYIQRPNGHITRNEEKWQAQYNKLVNFVTKENRIPSKHAKTNKDEQRLGQWVADMRKAQCDKKGSLTQQQITLLEKVKYWKWQKQVSVPPERPFEQMAQELAYFVRQMKHMPPIESVNPQTRSLVLWIIDMRAANIKNQLTTQQKEQLQQIPQWEWITRDRWYIYFKELQDFVTKTGHLPVRDSRDNGQSVIYKWTSVQRTDYNAKSLNNERIALMETIPGWQWEQAEANQQWLQSYNQAKEYIQTHNKVPTAGPLGKWVGHQREYYNNNTLAADRVELLKQLGSAWYWNMREKMFGQ